MRFLLLLLVLCSPFAAASPNPAPLLQQSEQLLFVFTPNWKSIQGQLQLYQRAKPTLAWKKVGNPKSVVIGQQGMGWDLAFAKQQWPGPLKTEGDYRTPAGIFKLGPAFGFAKTPDATLKLGYIPLTKTTVCVDDGRSHYYNQLLDAARIPTPDWTSSEAMRNVPFYNRGAVIQYNREPRVAGSGSCIFLHRWRDRRHGTAGCVAMDEKQLRSLLNALHPQQKPVLVILSAPAYAVVKKQWNLPPLA